MKPIKEPENIYPIGYKYSIKRHKCTKNYEVKDYLRTYNSEGDLMRFRYVSACNLMGQDVYDYDVIHTTIARSGG